MSMGNKRRHITAVKTRSSVKRAEVSNQQNAEVVGVVVLDQSAGCGTRAAGSVRTRKGDATCPPAIELRTLWRMCPAYLGTSRIR